MNLGLMQPQQYYPYVQPRRGRGVAIALIAIGLVIMIIAVALAYLEYVNSTPLMRYMGSGASISGVLELIGYVTYKSVFIAIIAWVGSMILARGAQLYVS